MRIVSEYIRLQGAEIKGDQKSTERAANHNSQIFRDFVQRDQDRLNKQRGFKERTEDAARTDVTKMDAIQKRRAKLAKVALDKRFELQFHRVTGKNKYINRLRQVNSVHAERE